MNHLNGFRYETQERLATEQREAALLAGQRDIMGMSKFEKESARSTTGCMGVFALLACIGCVWGLVAQTSADIRLDREGIVTEAEIDGTARGRAFFRSASVSYFVGGKPYTHSGTYYTGTERPGETVPVRYLPSDPFQARIVDRENRLPFTLMCLGGIVFFGLGTLGAVGRWQKLGIPEEPLGVSFNEPVSDGPDWATLPYQSARKSVPVADVPPTDAMPSADVSLNPLPTDSQRGNSGA